jgi:hypothetical protein
MVYTGALEAHAKGAGASRTKRDQKANGHRKNTPLAIITNNRFTALPFWLKNF